jgi:hypothetical protein
MLLKDSRKPSQTTKRVAEERAPPSNIPICRYCDILFCYAAAAAAPAASQCGYVDWEGLQASKANESKLEFLPQPIKIEIHR